MVTALHLTDQEVWEWCFDIYLKHNIRLKFPKNTDYTKTYQWRYVKSICNKFNEWEFDRDTAIAFIEIAVAYAKELKVLEKGLAVLHQGNMLNICYERLRSKDNDKENLLARLQYSYDHMAGISGDLFKYLIGRNSSRDFHQLTNDYMNNKICMEAISLVKPARKALKMISERDKIEAQILPDIGRLYISRTHLLDGSSHINVVQDLLAL